jgi:hypothetical protein
MEQASGAVAVFLSTAPMASFQHRRRFAGQSRPGPLAAPPRPHAQQSPAHRKIVNELIDLDHRSNTLAMTAVVPKRVGLHDHRVGLRSPVHHQRRLGFEPYPPIAIGWHVPATP